MTDKKIYEILNNLFPFVDQEKWDKSQIYFNFFNCEVKKIGLCLDVTLDVVNQVIATNCNLLVSHHPLYIDDVDQKKFYIKKIKSLLLKNKINLISCHTNFDVSSKGTNYCLLNELNLKNIKKASGSRYAFIGELKNKIQINELIANVKKSLDVEYVMFDKNDWKILNNKYIKRICILGGAGASEIDILKKKDKIDVFITSEVKWHQWEIAKYKNICLLQIPHSVEKIFIKKIKDVLNQFEIIEFFPKTIFEIR